MNFRMRPDTKKKKHHDSVKCEKKAKAKAAEEAKRDEKAQNQKKKQQPAKDEGNYDFDDW